MSDYKALCKNFKIDGDVLSVEPYGEGHINDTYLVVTTETKYILQRVNNTVFKNPEEVIANIAKVTGYMQKEIPLRVTHNDTKLNNVMIDDTTKEGVCVIDLDTVMPASMLYDFGGSIRFGASTATEDEKNLDKVNMDLALFEEYTKGYLEELGESITEKEADLLPMSAKLMTLECGVRFLTDYLDGDNYFKIHRPEHNLDRARTQLKLVWDMEQKMDEMKKIVAKYYKK